MCFLGIQHRITCVSWTASLSNKPLVGLHATHVHRNLSIVVGFIYITPPTWIGSIYSFRCPLLDVFDIIFAYICYSIYAHINPNFRMVKPCLNLVFFVDPNEQCSKPSVVYLYWLVKTTIFPAHGL